MVDSAVITAIASVGGALGGSGLTAWVNHRVSKRASHAADIGAEAQLQAALNTGFAALIGPLNTEIEHLRGDVQLLTRHVDSLERVLRDNGLAELIPPRVPHLVIVK